jgi:hypothetical protein
VRRAWCPQCGYGPDIDDDGCCCACGATAIGDGAEEAVALRSRVAELEPALQRIQGSLLDHGGRSVGLDEIAAEVERRLTELEDASICAYCGKPTDGKLHSLEAIHEHYEPRVAELEEALRPFAALAAAGASGLIDVAALRAIIADGRRALGMEVEP